MLTRSATIALTGVFAIAACVPPPGPPGPSLTAYPRQGKDYATFQREDASCRDTAARSTNGVSPGAAATNNGVASAVIGTGIGAAAGALLGAASGHAGAGAALGAGGGLLVGSAVGADNAARTGNSFQRHIDVVYAQCMSGYGNDVPGYRRPGYYPPPPGYGGPGPYERGPYQGGPYGQGPYDAPPPPPPGYN